MSGLTTAQQLLSTAKTAFTHHHHTDYTVYHTPYGVPRTVRDAIDNYLSSTAASTPLVVLDLDAFNANGKDMVKRANGTPLRVASKSLRMRKAITAALAMDGFHGVMAYSAREAIWLVREGIADNILVAYPTADAAAIAEIGQDEHLARSITLTFDSVDHLNFIDRCCPSHSRQEIRLCLDIDASLVVGKGMYIPGISMGNTDSLWDEEPITSRRSLRLGALRSPIHGVRDAQRLVRETWTRTNMRVVGLLAYEAQIAGEGDAGRSVRAAAVRLMQTLSRGELASRRKVIVDGVNFALHSAGLPQLEFINGGGTGSLESTGHEEEITEIGAGSGLIGSGLFDHYRSFRPYPAQWFVLPVVRRPGRGVVTIAGGGRIASGPAHATRLPRIDYPSGLRFSSTEGAGEVQTPLIGSAADSLHIGDLVWLRHAKAGEAAEWASSVIVVSGGTVVDEWPTYRGEGKVF